MRIKLIIFLFVLGASVSAQNLRDSSIFISSVSATYSFQIPGGDLADRFGVNSNIGASFTTKLKSNWTLGIEGLYLFGSNVKEDGIFDSIMTSEMAIINRYGDFASIDISERGAQISVKAGKIIPVVKSHPNSGIWINIGAGILQHKIWIAGEGNNAPQITGDYRKGYDRLTNGFAASEFLGYIFYGKSQIVNFYAGVEFTQAWTQSRRDYNFDTMTHDTRQRKDYLYSLKIGWVVPLYKKTPEKFYTY